MPIIRDFHALFSPIMIKAISPSPISEKSSQLCQNMALGRIIFAAELAFEGHEREYLFEKNQETRGSMGH